MLKINMRDSRPLYLQIKDNVRRLIISGVMAAGEKLPSVRELAMELAINPNTIIRAYRELEAEGYIYTIPGKGSFAGEGREVAQRRQQELLRIFDETVSELLYLGVESEMLIARMKGEKQHD